MLISGHPVLNKLHLHRMLFHSFQPPPFLIASWLIFNLDLFIKYFSDTVWPIIYCPDDVPITKREQLIDYIYDNYYSEIVEEAKKTYQSATQLGISPGHNFNPQALKKIQNYLNDSRCKAPAVYFFPQVFFTKIIPSDLSSLIVYPYIFKAVFPEKISINTKCLLKGIVKLPALAQAILYSQFFESMVNFLILANQFNISPSYINEFKKNYIRMFKQQEVKSINAIELSQFLFKTSHRLISILNKCVTHSITKDDLAKGLKSLYSILNVPSVFLKTGKNIPLAKVDVYNSITGILNHTAKVGFIL